jgi:hypothetical protein
MYFLPLTAPLLLPRRAQSSRGRCLAEAASVINGANAISNLTRLPRVSASTEMNLRAQPKALLSPAVQAVKRLHSELGCEILENKQEAQRVAGQMLDVETVIKMLDRGIAVSVRRDYSLVPDRGWAQGRRDGNGVLRTRVRRQVQGKPMPSIEQRGLETGQTTASYGPRLPIGNR